MKDVEGPDHIQHPFYRAKVGDVSEEKFIRSREGGAPRLRAKLRSEFIRIDEVRDDLDWAACAEEPQGFAGKLVAHGGDAIGSIQAEAGDFEEGIVESHESDIRPMQRGNRRRPLLRREHLRAEPGRDGMRDGVVYVEDVERLLAADLGKLGGEGQGIGWVFEKGIGGHLDLVEEGVGMGVGDAEGKRVAEKVNMVPPGRELETKLRGDDAASPVGRVADDAEIQFSSRRFFHGTTEY